jgi:hypothetical protein
MKAMQIGFLVVLALMSVLVQGCCKSPRQHHGWNVQGTGT